MPSRFMLRKPELSAGLMGHLALKQTLPFKLSVDGIVKCDHSNES